MQAHNEAVKWKVEIDIIYRNDRDGGGVLIAINMCQKE